MYVTCAQAESVAASILCSSQLYGALVCFFFLVGELNIVRVDLNSVIKLFPCECCFLSADEKHRVLFQIISLYRDF